MNDRLQPDELNNLESLRMKCENILADPYLVRNTNVQEVYQIVMDQIIYETDPLLNAEIYTIPFISKPISE